jgi:hypothetical protein
MASHADAAQGGCAMTATEQIWPRPKKGRGRAQRSLDLIDAMYDAAEAAQPITGRGIGYKMFVAKLIPSMGRTDMRCVYRLLKEARENGDIPWEWIVDETRDLEKSATWDNAEEFADTMADSYRREFWNDQPVRVEVWSEKGTVRGVLAPVLDQYGVGFGVMHGFNSATCVYNVSQDDDGRELIVLYCGDFDPSGLCMSEDDLPKRLVEYGGDHVMLKRIALTGEQVLNLPSFPAADKKTDSRYKWFTARFGDRCWELDAMDPNDLRTCVEKAIKEQIEPEAWERCEIINKAERESMKEGVGAWLRHRQTPEAWETAYEDWHGFSGSESSGDLRRRMMEDENGR